MAAAVAVAGAKTWDTIKLVAESARNGTFRPVICLTEEYALNGCFLQQIINVPVKPFMVTEVAL